MYALVSGVVAFWAMVIGAAIYVYWPLHLQGVTREECIRSVPALEPYIPRDAANVSVRGLPRAVRFAATFLVDESNFASWVKERGIQTTQLGGPWDCFECYVENPPQPQLVAGWNGEIEDGGRSMFVAYDRATGDGYVTVGFTR